MTAPTTLRCARCGTDAPRMAFQPFNNALGKRAFDEICTGCWAQWLKLQQQLINHYGLDLRDAKAKQFLFGQMETFLFGGGESPFETAQTPPVPIS